MYSFLSLISNQTPIYLSIYPTSGINSMMDTKIHQKFKWLGIFGHGLRIYLSMTICTNYTSTKKGEKTQWKWKSVVFFFMGGAPLQWWNQLHTYGQVIHAYTWEEFYVKLGIGSGWVEFVFVLNLNELRILRPYHNPFIKPIEKFWPVAI